MTTSQISHRRLLRVAGPIILSNATVPLPSAVDTAVIGRLGQAAPPGAVGLGAVMPGLVAGLALIALQMPLIWGAVRIAPAATLWRAGGGDCF